MLIHEGDRAAEFQLESIDGGMLSLHELLDGRRTGRAVLLVFLRHLG